VQYAQLRAFHAVAEHGGFSKAAQALSLTQPAVSDHVRRLEQDYGVKLFERGPRGVETTELRRTFNCGLGMTILVPAAQREAAAQRAARALAEHPVVYYAQVEPEVAEALRQPDGVAESLARLTGLAVERRAEGVLLADAGGRFTDIDGNRTPEGGSIVCSNGRLHDEVLTRLKTF